METEAKLPPDVEAVDPTTLPPVLYVPCVEHVADIADVEFSLRATRDGRTALLAYTALDRLRDGCGADQAWVLLPLAGLSALHREHPWDLLVLDVVVPADRRDHATAAIGRPIGDAR